MYSPVFLAVVSLSWCGIRRQGQLQGIVSCSKRPTVGCLSASSFQSSSDSAGLSPAEQLCHFQQGGALRTRGTPVKLHPWLQAAELNLDQHVH